MAKGYFTKVQEARYKNFGDDFDYESFPKNLYDLYSVPIDYVRVAMEPAINNTSKKKYHYMTGFIAKNTINALTCDIDDGSIICINSSVPLLLFRLCVQYAYCCDIQTALSSGNPIVNLYSQKANIVGKLAHNENFPHKIMQLYNSFKESEIYRCVKDCKKLKYAIYMYDLATRFLAMHECMHVVLGHTAYMKKKFGFSELYAFPQDDISNDKILKMMQAIEFLSDCYTVAGVFRQSLIGNLCFDYLEYNDVKITVDKECFVARSVVNALSVLFHLIPFNYEKLTDTIASKHAHPYIRLQWIISVFSTQLSSANNFKEYLIKPFAQAMVVFYENFNTLTDWIKVNELNKIDEQGLLSSSESCDTIIKEAKSIEHLMKKFAPIY